MLHTSRTFSILFALSIARVAIDAQTTNRPDSARAALTAVVVTATRSSTTLERMPLHATVVTQADIQKTPALTLDQLLRDVPGVNLPGAPYYATDPTGHQTRLRGVSNSKVLVLVDGIPVHDPFYSTTQWFKVPLSSIERVEVIRGGASSLWGNLAVAGVVNIITKKPIDTRGRADLTYQSRQTLNGAVAQNILIGASLALRVSADVLRTNGYQTTPEAFLSALPGKGASSAKNANAQIAAYWTPVGPVSGFARLGYHEQNEDIGGYRYGANIQRSPDAALGVIAYLSDNLKAELRGWGQDVTFDKSNGAACYLVSASTCNNTATDQPLVQFTNSRDDNPYRELGASGVMSWSDFRSRAPSLQAGADLRAVGGEDHATTYNRPTAADVSSATINRTNFGRGTQRFAGVFAQLHLTPVDRLEATLNARYDYWTNTNGVAEMVRFSNGAPGATLGGAVGDSHRGSFNPSLALRFDLTSAVSLRGAAYRSFRAPGLNNLYRSFSTTTSITIANAELSPETLVGGEVGSDFRAGHATLGATWFEYDTKSLIASHRIPDAASAPAAVIAICGASLANCPATVNFNTNGQDAISRGLELVASWRPASVVAIDASYTFTDSHYTSATTGDPTGVQLGAIPKHVATVGTTWQFTNRWSGYVGAHHNGAMYLDVNQTIPQPAVALFNASTSYRVRDGIELYASGTNLSNERYADNATTSAAGQILGLPRSFASGLRVRF